MLSVWWPLWNVVLWFQVVRMMPQLDEFCEHHSANTMHDFCCDLHDESPQFSDCQTDWHDKIHYTTDEDELLYLYCTAECTYNSTDFLATNRQSLNLNHVREHLENDLANAADEALLYEAYVKCDKHALGQLEHKDVQLLAKRLTTYGCHPFPGLVMECMVREMILKCPADRFHKTAQCRVVRQYLQKCEQRPKK
ncbi:uncharacterized protein LOC6579051 [Drosophila mojavensis]|uniref:Odorant-binding protein 46a, isoform A n=1 Tax=Drosophila mojavensis TaxID=7230 RepID=B4KN56_DROMO|nr:uncharacterized protein LOC6579051 [Drosophila mojavensis]EDW08883.1 Odorant-binding protein 46a, isoform A [Drosophila mojavensis]KRG04331.1 Odorant-binding protein 46a, isoform B [Drosophila mojavensis]